MKTDEIDILEKHWLIDELEPDDDEMDENKLIPNEILIEEIDMWIENIDGIKDTLTLCKERIRNMQLDILAANLHLHSREVRA